MLGEIHSRFLDCTDFVILVKNEFVHFPIKSRVIREILTKCGRYRIEKRAVQALQKANELMLVQIFQDSVVFATHTLADLQLSAKFHGQRQRQHT